jgi:hypothetical protein
VNLLKKSRPDRSVVPKQGQPPLSAGFGRRWSCRPAGNPRWPWRFNTRRAASPRRAAIPTLGDVVVGWEAAHKPQRYGVFLEDTLDRLAGRGAPEAGVATREILFGFRPGYSALRATMRRCTSGGSLLRLAASEPRDSPCPQPRTEPPSATACDRRTPRSPAAARPPRRRRARAGGGARNPSARAIRTRVRSAPTLRLTRRAAGAVVSLPSPGLQSLKTAASGATSDRHHILQ